MANDWINIYSTKEPKNSVYSVIFLVLLFAAGVLIGVFLRSSTGDHITSTRPLALGEVPFLFNSSQSSVTLKKRDVDQKKKDRLNTKTLADSSSSKIRTFRSTPRPFELKETVTSTFSNSIVTHNETEVTEADLRSLQRSREEAERKAREDAKIAVEGRKKDLMEAKREAEAQAKAKREAEAQAKRDAEAQAKIKLEAEALAKAQREAEAESKAKREAEAQAKAKREAQAQAKAKQEAQAQVKAKQEAQAQAKAEREAKAKAKREAQIKAKAQAKAEREAKAKAKREAQIKAKAQAKAEREAKAKAKREARAQAKAEREAKAKAKREARAQAKAERVAQAKAKREARAQAKAEREAQAKAKREAQLKAKREAQAKRAAEYEATQRSKTSKNTQNTPEEKSKKARFTLQVKAFRRQREAEIYLKNLNRSGDWDSQIIKAQSKGRAIYRIWVGAFDTRAQADLERRKFIKKFGSQDKPFITPLRSSN